MNRMFFVDIAAECKRLKCTPSVWSNEEMTFFVQQKVFNSIPQEGLETYFARKFTYEKAERRAELFREFVESVMYKYLATVEAGRDYEAAVELAREAKLEKVLQSEALGGKAEWSLADFLDETVWHECGGQTGLKEISKKFLTLIVAGGQKAKPVNPVCTVCGELKWIHKGDRLNLAYIACKCDGTEAVDVDQKDINGRRDLRGESETERAPKRTRGFSDDLDPTCHGIFETYERKCKQIDTRFRDLSTKEIVKKLLGRSMQQVQHVLRGARSAHCPARTRSAPTCAHVPQVCADSDDEALGAPSQAEVGVTGPQGGRLLVCLLVRAEQAGEDTFLADGVKAFLEKQAPKVVLFPAAKLCLEKALKFLPVLERGLAKHAAAAAGRSDQGPELDFGDD